MKAVTSELPDENGRDADAGDASRRRSALEQREESPAAQAEQKNTRWCILMCMRTNIVLNDELLAEAMRYSGGRSKRAVVDEALRLYVEMKAAAQRRQEYLERYRSLERKLRKLRLRQSPAELLRTDRDRE
jgi:Arc/MetJ family transcription regulator